MIGLIVGQLMITSCVRIILNLFASFWGFDVTTSFMFIENVFYGQLIICGDCLCRLQKYFKKNNIHRIMWNPTTIVALMHQFYNKIHKHNYEACSAQYFVCLSILWWLFSFTCRWSLISISLIAYCLQSHMMYIVSLCHLSSTYI